jgi:flagellar basal body rod protein FlgC
MDSFAIFKVAQSGMDRQQQMLTLLATQMSTRQLTDKSSPQGFSQHIQTPTENTPSTINDPPSYLLTVTSMMETMRLYRMNTSIASAARSMIESSLQISGK